MTAPVLVAAFGHAWMQDESFGLKVVNTLRTRALPPSVQLADWSFGTLTAVQQLMVTSYARTVFLSASRRPGRAAGTLHRDQPDIRLPSPDEIHARIVDCVMGAVSVDNLLIIARFYGALPDDVVLIEAEPVEDGWGSELSPAVEALVEHAVALTMHEIERVR